MNAIRWTLALLLCAGGTVWAQGGYLTQVVDDTTVDINVGVVCEDTNPPAGSLPATFDGSFWRSFDLVNGQGLPAGVPIEIDTIVFAVRDVVAGNADGVIVTLRLWEDFNPSPLLGTANATIDINNLVLLFEGDVFLNDTIDTVFTEPMRDLSGESATAIITPNVNRRLVIEVAVGNLIGTQGSFYPGGNSLGESQDTFFSSAGCGINVPQTYASLGFPGEHLIIGALWAPVGTFEIRPGSGEGVVMESAIGNDIPSTGAEFTVKQAQVGDQILMQTFPLDQGFVGLPAILVAQLSPTGLVPTSPDTNFPEIHLDFGSANAPVILYDGTQQGLLGGIGPFGLTLSFTTPPGLVGQSAMFQWAIVDPFLLGPGFNNGFFASSEGHVVEFI
jgi:hypothetical protein